MNLPEVARVLLVDDDPQDRRRILSALRGAFSDIEARQITDGDEFAAALRDDPCDIVITELQVGWLNGPAYTVLEEVNSVFPNCPVLLVTRQGNEAIAVEAMKRGFADYIVKDSKDFERLPAAARFAVVRAGELGQAGQTAIDLGALLGRLNIGYFLCDGDGRLLVGSPTFQQLLDVDSLTAAGQRLNEIIAAAGIDFCALEQRLQAGGPLEMEIPQHFVPNATGMRRIILTKGQFRKHPPLFEGLIRELSIQLSDAFRASRGGFAEEKLAVLTARERQVFDAVVAGHPNKITARQLHITEKTVEKHRSRIMKKLSARSVADLVKLALGHPF